MEVEWEIPDTQVERDNNTPAQFAAGVGLVDSDRDESETPVKFL
jgi:hypothetical protein